MGNIAIFPIYNLCNKKYCTTASGSGFLTDEMKTIIIILIVSFCALCTKYERFFIHISQNKKTSKKELTERQNV